MEEIKHQKAIRKHTNATLPSIRTLVNVIVLCLEAIAPPHCQHEIAGYPNKANHCAKERLSFVS
jgi:hypothetical protein